VLDASHLDRGLCLTRELLDMSVPVVVALTFTDLARRHGLEVDVPRLAAALGCPVVAVTGRTGEGMDALAAALAGAVRGLPGARPEAPARPADAEAADAAAEARRTFARGLARAVMRRAGPPRPRRSDRMDRVLLSGWAGIPVFAAVLYAVFWVTVRATQPLVHFIDAFAGAFLVHGPRAWLGGLGAPEWVVALAVDGAGAGLVAVATFLPPIFAIFLCLGLLEASGYMPRAAFVMDRLLRRIGLPGKAFLPMLVGFGCTVPALLATRTLEARRDRVLTMLVTPFMSCGARLPVYTIFAIAFFPRHADVVVFVLYAIGVALAVLSGLLLRHTLLRGEAAPYVLELPPYQIPPWRQCLDHAWFNLRSFLARAGVVIVGVAVVLSLFESAGHAWVAGRAAPSAGASHPAAAVGRALAPATAPMGIAADNWPATVALLTGLLAKEAVIGTLDALYAQAGPDAGRPGFSARGEVARAFRELGEAYHLLPERESAPPHGAWPGMMQAMRQRFATGTAAFAYLLFVLIYSPCLAALAVLAAEAGWRWAAFSVSYQTVLAWLAATSWFQAATWRQHPASSAGWLAAAAAVLLAMALAMRAAGRRRTPIGGPA
jgi:ferrous iron transport protein B